MPIRPQTNPDEEAASVARSRQAWDKILAARRTVTAADAQAVSTMAANYPHMSPGTVVPLAQARVAPDDPLAQKVALEEAKSNKRKRGFMGALGDFVGGITHIPFEAAQFGISHAVNPLGSAALGATKQILRPGLAALAAPFEVGTGVLRNVAAATGDIGAGIASGAAVGAAAGLAGGPLAPLSVLAGAGIGAVAGGIAGGAAEMKGVEIKSDGFVNPLQQSALFQSFGQAGLGTGYMPGGTAHEEATAAARRAASINGHALTPGRFLATSIVEPGTAPYNLLSGALDAGTAWELDPANIAGKGLTKWKKAQAGFTATEKEIAAASRVSRIERNDAGLVEGARKTVISEKVNTWLGTAKGQKSMQWFADADFTAIRNQLGNKIEISTVRQLADAATPAEVEAILRPQLGIERGLELKPKVGGFGMEVKRQVKKLPGGESRLFADLPSGNVDYSNPTDAVDQFNLLLRDANLPVDEAARHTEQFANHLLEGTFEGRRKADALMASSLGGVQGKVGQSDAGRALIKKLHKRAAAGNSEVLRSLIDEDVTRTPSLNATIGGETVGLPPSGFLVDHMDNGIDVSREVLRDIRAATSKYARIANNPKFQTGVTLGDHITNDMWKPAALLRGAWTVRVVGEEQVRMAAAGRMSLFNHPISYLAWAMDDEGKIANIFKKHGINIGGRGGVDIAGERFAREGTTTISNTDALEAELRDAGDEFGIATNYKAQNEGWHGDGFTQAGHKVTYTRGEVGHVEAVAEALDNAASDPLMRMLAGDTRPNARRWFIEGEGNEMRQALVQKHGAPLASSAQVDTHLDNAQRTLNKALGRIEGPPPATPLAPAGSRSSAPGMEAMGTRRPQTGIRPLEAAPTPEPWRAYGGTPAAPTGPTEALPYGRTQGPTAPQVPGLNPTDPTKLAQRAAGGPHDPLSGLGGTSPAPTYAPRTGAVPTPGSAKLREAVVTGELNGVKIRKANGTLNPDFLGELRKIEDELPESIVGMAVKADKRWAAKRDKAIQHLYTNMMTRPSAKLSRSPMFRQTYWEEAEGLITEMDRAGQARLLDNARKAKLDRQAIGRLEARAKASTGELRLTDVDTLLKGRALDATQELLYDAARRGQMSDVLRIVMPFMEAQKEVMKVWAKVGVMDNPNLIRRSQQLLSAARGSGAFYKDPTTGEEMFTFPGSEFLTEHTLGMPIPLTGRVAGLNMFGSGIVPGMGPAVQIPTRWLLPDKPQYDDLRKFMDPFGSTAGETEGILEQQFPGWLTAAKRAMAADDNDRTFSNSVKDVWAVGVSQGRYRTGTPEEIKDGLEDAKQKARWLYGFKAFSSLGGAPTPPSPAFKAMDKEGKWHMAKVLSEDYRAMMDDPNIGPSGASQAFLEKYGNNAAAFMQSKTYSTVPSAPSTGEFRNWTRSAEASQLKDRFGPVAALFGPQGEGFDYTQYLRNIQAGDTVNLTPEQFTQQTNNRIAQMIYFNQKDRFGPSPSREQRSWLADLKVALRDKYPGYDIPLPGKPDQDTVKKQYIPAIEKAVADDSLADNDVARAAKIYLQARQAAIASARGGGIETFTQAKAAAPLRDWLRQILDALAQRVPDFSVMAERVFDREMVSDEEVQTGQGAAA